MGPVGGVRLGTPFGVPVHLAASWPVFALFMVLYFGPQVQRAAPGLGASAYAGELVAPDLVWAASIGAALPLLVLLAVWRPIARPLGGVLVVGYVAYIAAVIQGRI